MKWQHLRPNSSQDTGVYWGQRQKVRGGMSMSMNLKEHDVVALQMVDIFKCHTSHPIFPATEPLSLGQLRKGGINHHFPGYIRKQEDSHQYHVGMQFMVFFTIEDASGVILTEWYFPPRRAENGEQIDLELEWLSVESRHSIPRPPWQFSNSQLHDFACLP